MRFFTKGKRITALVLALILLVTNAQLPTLIYAVDGETYSSNIGGTAVFNSDLGEMDSIYLSADPSTGNVYGHAVNATKFNTLDLVLEIVDCHIGNGVYWYKIKAAAGYSLPSELESYPWVLQNDLGESAYPDALIVTPKSTEPSEPTETTVPSEPVVPDLDKITVEGIPEGAVVEVKDFSDIADEGSNIGIYDIKVKDANGDYWQPTLGETVRVSIPAPVGADTVDVVHFLEDATVIKWALDSGKAEIVNVSGAINDTKYYILEPAVKAYQEATDSTDACVAVEIFCDVIVVGGCAIVDTHGLSAFTAVPPQVIVEAEAAFPDIYGTNTYSVRPDEWIRVSGWTIYSEITISSGDDYCTVIDASESALFGDTAMYIHINDDPELVGKTVKLKFGLFGQRNITFNIVKDFDYGKVYIGVVGHNSTTPNELSLHAQAQPDYYLVGSGLQETQKENRLYPSTLINLGLVKSSNALVNNTAMTVYGILASETVDVEAFLHAADKIGEDGQNYDGLTDVKAAIKEAYFSLPANASLDPDNYEVVPYVVKRETIGSNAGWYVNFKIELKAMYKVSYDYNVPEGFNVVDHLQDVKKPGNKDVPTHDSNGNIISSLTTTVDQCVRIGENGEYIPTDEVMQLIKEDGNKTYTANFLGWSLSKNATTPDYQAGDEIKLSGSVTLYAVWSDSGMEYNSAIVTFLNLLKKADGSYFSTDDSFVYTVSNNLTQSYIIYNASGIKQREGSFASDKTVTLKGGEYIVIDAVPNGSYSFELTSYVAAAYNIGTTKVEFTLNATTNTSGRYVADHTSTLKRYTVEFRNYDNTLLQSTVVDYGAMPSYNGETPDKPDTAEFDFTFTGWDKEISAVTGNVVYTAQYSQTVNKYTVTFVDEDGTVLKDAVAYDYGTPADQIVKPADPAPKVTPQYTYTFTGWDKEIAAVTGNVTYTATYSKTTNKYTVTFVDEDGTVLKDAVAYDYGTPADQIAKPADPATKVTAEYTYTFAGWDPKVDTVTGNVTYTATYTATPNPYTITWVVDGVTVKSVTVNFGATVNATAPADPTKTGHTFTGWNTEIPETMPANDVVITATWAINKYTITFVLGNGQDNIVIKQDYGTAITAPVPTWEGHGFAGWDQPVPPTMPAEDMTITAKWTVITYTIQYELGLTADQLTNADLFTNQTKAHGVDIQLHGTPTANGAIFLGWAIKGSDDETVVVYAADAVYTANSDVTLVAVWDPTPFYVNYSVSGIVDGTNVNFASQQGYFGNKITIHTPPVIAGHTIEKITVDGVEVQAGHVVTINNSNVEVVITYKAVETTISFNAKGGSAVAAITKPYYSDVVAPVAPTKYGYEFLGWYTDEDCTNAYTFGKMPAEDITLYAKWERSITSLTIKVAGMQSIDAMQSFLFNIEGEADGVDLQVVVYQNGEVKIDGLVIGNTYTVTYQKAWSWRYSIKQPTDIVGTNITAAVGDTEKVTFTLAENGVLTFNMTRVQVKWLDGNDLWLKPTTKS